MFAYPVPKLEVGLKHCAKREGYRLHRMSMGSSEISEKRTLRRT